MAHDQLSDAEAVALMRQKMCELTMPSMNS